MLRTPPILKSTFLFFLYPPAQVLERERLQGPTEKIGRIETAEKIKTTKQRVQTTRLSNFRVRTLKHLACV